MMALLQAILRTVTVTQIEKPLRLNRRETAMTAQYSRDWQHRWRERFAEQRYDATG